MGLVCPVCWEINVKVETQIELPPDNRSDEISIQIIKCSKCDFEGIAIYEESRRGALNDESYNHRGYHVSPSILQEIKGKIAKCPSPRNIRCQCKTHSQLKKKDESGNWTWNNYLNSYESFQIQFKSS